MAKHRYIKVWHDSASAVSHDGDHYEAAEDGAFEIPECAFKELQHHGFKLTPPAAPEDEAPKRGRKPKDQE